MNKTYLINNNIIKINADFMCRAMNESHEIFRFLHPLILKCNFTNIPLKAFYNGEQIFYIREKKASCCLLNATKLFKCNNIVQNFLNIFYIENKKLSYFNICGSCLYDIISLDSIPINSNGFNSKKLIQYMKDLDDGIIARDILEYFKKDIRRIKTIEGIQKAYKK